MNQVFEQLRYYHRLFSQFDQVHSLAKQQYDDPPVHILMLPYVYQQLAKTPNIDPLIVDLVGEYLRGRFPSLRDQFLTDAQSRTQQEMNTMLRAFFKERE